MGPISPPQILTKSMFQFFASSSFVVLILLMLVHNTDILKYAQAKVYIRRGRKICWIAPSPSPSPPPKKKTPRRAFIKYLVVNNSGRHCGNFERFETDVYFS